MGVAVADLDDDGDRDLLVVNLMREADSLLRNDGAYFVDITRAAGLAVISRQFTRFGVGFHDFDNDGWRDLYEANGRVRRLDDTVYDPRDAFAEPNLLFRGVGPMRFQEVQPRGGTEPILIATSRAAAFGDIDNDGGVDILIANRDGPAHLLRNIVASRGRWITFRVVEEHGRDALGASLTLRLGPRTLSCDVQSASSYCAANDPRVHVGLGDADVAGDVVVTWIDGVKESFGDQPAGRIVTLTRSAGRPVP
jgi:enediyne biosynthesis protein E4